MRNSASTELQARWSALTYKTAWWRWKQQNWKNLKNLSPEFPAFSWFSILQCDSKVSEKGMSLEDWNHSVLWISILNQDCPSSDDAALLDRVRPFYVDESQQKIDAFLVYIIRENERIKISCSPCVLVTWGLAEVSHPKIVQDFALTPVQVPLADFWASSCLEALTPPWRQVFLRMSDSSQFHLFSQKVPMFRLSYWLQEPCKSLLPIYTIDGNILRP